MPGNHAGQRESAELIRDALERCPPGATASRARLLVASARPAAASARPEDEQHITGRVSIAGRTDPDIEARLREAVTIARVAGEPEVLAFALTRLRLYIASPDTLDERLALTKELADVHEAIRNPVSRFEAHLARHEDLLEAGDIDGARIEARAVRRLGEDLGAGGMMAAGDSFLVTHATADGDLQQAMALLFESRRLEADTGSTSNSAYRFGIQFLMIRWHQGRVGELYDGYRRAVDVAPRLTEPRASLAFICAEAGMLDEARHELRQLAHGPVAEIPRDYMWWLTMIFMTHAAIATDERELAAELYGALRPYAERNASTAGAVSFGSAALFVGRLAWFLGEDAEAGEYLEHALAFNVRTRQRTWAARTRHHVARFLLDRGMDKDVPRARDLMRIALDDAREIGMPRLAADIERIMSG
jgi:hypothetical protein